MWMSASTTARPSFYFIGDSITEQGSSLPGGGFVSLLQSEYVRSVDMVNRGLTGYTTRCVGVQIVEIGRVCVHGSMDARVWIIAGRRRGLPSDSHAGAHPGSTHGKPGRPTGRAIDQ
ncbi:hypothetical protein PybrP1_003969 [[Pythium] brassicae (nom. inval.)]|nr:hypothetical protein PybrP1_003969 [[Pythium] brassicae (nom. inval.)]